MFQPGEYLCEVVQQGFKESQTGNPMIVLTVVPTHRIDAAGVQHEVFERIERTINMAITSATRDFAMQRLRHAGFTGKSLAELQLVGSQVECFCQHEVYKDKPRDRFDLSLPRERPRDFDDDAVNQLDAMFGDALTQDFTGEHSAGSVEPTRSKGKRKKDGSADEPTPF